MLQRKLKYLIPFIISAGIASPSFAVAPAFYLGFGLGPASNNASPQLVQTRFFTTPGLPPLVLAKPRSNQFGVRFFLGYQFLTYAAWEFGIDLISPIKFVRPRGSPDTCSSTEVRAGGFDLLGKLILPISCFSAFAKGGVAITYYNAAGAFTPNFIRDCGRSTNEVKFHPAYGLGAGYDLNQNWVLDVSWTRIQVGRIVNNIDFYAVSISYHFVDKYCGQFLCDD